MAHLDHVYLKDIISLVGAEQFAGLREQFIRDCEQAIAVLEAAAAKGDEAPVVRQAHWLKGVLGQYGAREAERMAQTVSHNLPADWPARVRELIEETRQACIEMRNLV